MADPRIPFAIRRVKEAALVLHTYMTYRAKREGVDHLFPVSFYEEAIADGCWSFFGVKLYDWRVVEDEEQPDIFFDWNVETTLDGMTVAGIH